MSITLFQGALSAITPPPVGDRLSPQLLALEAAIVAEHEALADSEGGFTGFADGFVFDSQSTVTTADALRAQIETWKNAGGTTTLDLLCDWDGIQDFTSPSLRGPASSALTADAGVFGGYQRPAGGVRIRPATGRTPAFGNPIIIYGMPLLELKDIGLAAQANGGDGDNIRAIQLSVTGTFPLPNAVAFTDCKIGLGHWRPAEDFTEYVKSISSNGTLCLSVHVEGCDFNGCRDQTGAATKYLRIKHNYARNCISDFGTCFGFDGGKGWTSADRASCWLEYNIVSDPVDDISLALLHQDFFQTGTAVDAHGGYSVLGRYNVINFSAVESGGTQGFYNDDHLTASSEFLFHDNIVLVTSPAGTAVWNSDAARSSYIEGNTFSVSALRPIAQDFVPGIRVFDLGGNGAFNDLFLRNNVISLLSDDSNLITLNEGNLFVSAKMGTVSGDGSTQAEAIRTEAVFAGPFNRDGSDFLTFSVDEGGDDKAVTYYSIVDHMEPLVGWDIEDWGASNPEDWPEAPDRLGPVIPPVTQNIEAANDRVYNSLLALGYTGALPDMIFKHLSSLTGDTSSVPDMATKQFGSFKAYWDSLL